MAFHFWNRIEYPLGTFVQQWNRHGLRGTTTIGVWAVRGSYVKVCDPIADKEETSFWTIVLRFIGVVML